MRELLAGYAETIAELRRRGVVRTNNAPLGDYAEWLVATALNAEVGIAANRRYIAAASLADLVDDNHQLSSLPAAPRT